MQYHAILDVGNVDECISLAMKGSRKASIVCMCGLFFFLSEKASFAVLFPEQLRESAGVCEDWT